MIEEQSLSQEEENRKGAKYTLTSVNMVLFKKCLS